MDSEFVNQKILTRLFLKRLHLCPSCPSNVGLQKLGNGLAPGDASWTGKLCWNESGVQGEEGKQSGPWDKTINKTAVRKEEAEAGRTFQPVGSAVLWAA